MRYAENREQSAEILRLSLAYMGHQTAAFHPYSYAVWYEHCAGLNPALSRILEARQSDNSPLTDEDVRRLYNEHILTRDIQQYEHFRGEFSRILQDTAANTEAAGEKVTEFDGALAGCAQQLTNAPGPEVIRSAVEDLRSDTGKMRVITAMLSAQLKESHDKIDALNEKLERREGEALIDPLTGLNNRRGFEEAVRELQGQHGDLSGAALMMIDIDHFKVVNDLHGHLLGDKVLRAVAHALKSNTKGRDLVARMGGEEFVILLPETSLPGAAALGRQIRSLVANGRIKKSDGGTIGQVTLSIGVAGARQNELLDKLLERADAALYTAKDKGRNRVELAPL